MNNSFSSPDPDLDALFAQARAVRPDTSRWEYAFETRLLARLSRPHPAAGLGGVAWRLAPFFALIVLGLGLFQAQQKDVSQEAAQTAALQNPETVDLFATFQ